MVEQLQGSALYLLSSCYQFDSAEVSILASPPLVVSMCLAPYLLSLDLLDYPQATFQLVGTLHCLIAVLEELMVVDAILQGMLLTSRQLQPQG